MSNIIKPIVNKALSRLAPNCPKFLKKILRPVKRIIMCGIGMDVFVVPDVKCAIEYHGSAYGGWNILSDSLSTGAIVISCGLGHDITFDESIISRYGCRVVGFDPDPRAWRYHENRIFPVGFEWRKVGVGAESGFLSFYQPKRSDYISGTLIANRPNHELESVEVHVLDIATIVKELAAGRRGVDVLKMDIEGAEYGVIDRLVETGCIYDVGQLLVEFHHGDGVLTTDMTRRAIAALRVSGFRIGSVSDTGREFTLLNSKWWML